MNLANTQIAPELMRRACGGWLAVAPKGSLFSIGVTAQTAEEAREKFGLTIQRWIEILESDRMRLVKSGD